jgi:hypothetical protein
MEINKEDIEIILEVFEEYNDMLSNFSKGTMNIEEWAVYNKLNQVYEIHRSKIKNSL